MNFSRQIEIFDPATFNTPVHVIGAGATGSWVTLFLAKLGVKDITVWDFDRVEEHNLPNQAFGLIDIGLPKADAVAAEVLRATGTVIKANIQEVNARTRLNGIVFMLTDTMKSRKEIWDGAIKLNYGVKLLIETRMGLRGGRIYTIFPTDIQQIRKYEGTFYTDEEATASACGVSQSIICTAVNIASLAVWQFLKYNREEDFSNELLIDYISDQIIPFSY